MPVAEESDLIIKLGSHVLLRAAHDAARWQTELPRSERPLFVSVNVSSRQIFRPESVQEIRHILGRNIVPRGVLRLEVTETLVMENPEQSAEVLETLRGAGADLALDDFGTGYSSLAYLQRFPFDTIKVDREIVRGSATPTGAAILRSIVALAHELSKRVVAEGVEEAEQATFLRSIGCEYAQGYHFGEPIPERDVIQLLKMVRKSERKMQPRGFFRPKTQSARDAAIASATPSAKKNGTVKPAIAVQPPRGQTQTPAQSSQESKAHVLANTTVRHRHKPSPAQALEAEVNKPGSLAPARAENTMPPIEMVKSMPPVSVPNSGNGNTRPPTAMPMMSQNAIPPSKTQMEASANGARPKPFPASPFPAPVPQQTAPPQQAASPVTQPPNMARPLADALARAMPPGVPMAASNVVPSNGNYPRTLTGDPATGWPNGTTAPPPLPTTLPPQQMQPDLSSLPPGVAASLARLAGVKSPAASKPDEPPAGG